MTNYMRWETPQYFKKVVMKTKITTIAMIILLAMPTIHYSQIKTKKMKTLTRTNTETVKQMFNAMGNKDLDTWLSYWDENGVLLIPFAPDGFPKSVEGKDALGDAYRNLLSGYGDLNFTHIEINPLEDEDQIVVKWGVDIELNGSEQNYQNELIGTFEFKNGKVVRLTEYFNPDNFVKVIGNKNIEHIKRFLQSLREKDMNKMESFFTEDAVYSNPFASDFFKIKVHKGSKTIAELFSVMPNLMETVEIFNLRTYPSGSDYVITEFDIKFTFKNGYVYTNDNIISVFGFENGLINKWTEYLEPTNQEAAFNQDFGQN